MSFLNGIFNRGAAPAPAPAPAAPAQQPQAAGPAMKQPEPANPGAAPAALTTAQGQGSQQPAGGPQNPLDAFSNLFAPPQVDPKKPKPVTLADPILGQLDPAVFQQQVSQANFAAAIPQETIQKAMSGDAAAFGEAINAAAREAFAAAAKLSHGLVEHGAREAATRVDRSVDSRVRQALIRGQNTEYPILQHAAVAPIADGVKSQIAKSNPHLTPQEVVAKTAEYFQALVGSFPQPQSAQQAAQQPQGPKDQDFSTYLN